MEAGGDMNISVELKVFAKNLSILIIEDDENLNKELVEIAKIFFKDVKFAFDGEEGLAIYKQNKVDIILSDITMPFLNGIELSKKVKNLNHNQNIVILSAHSELSYLIDLIDIGVRQFVHKPFDDQELLYRLLKVCEEIVLSKENLKNQETLSSGQQFESEMVVKNNIVIEKSGLECVNHEAINGKNFMKSLEEDTVAWEAVLEDISMLLELNSDFQYYIGLIYTDKITKDILFCVSSVLRKMYTALASIEVMSGMTTIFYSLISFIENLDYSEMSDEQLKKFKMLEFIYDDISRFIETIFVYKDSIDIYYLQDSLKVSIEQLKQNVLNLPLENEEELELF